MIEIKVTAGLDHGPLRAQVVESMAALGFLPMNGTAPAATPTVTTDTKSEVDTTKKTGRPKNGAQAEEQKQSIQTGEERVGPEDDAETQARDAADEAADKADTDAVTLDSIKDALGEYVKTYGMPATQEDGPKLLKLIFGEKVSKVSDIPNEPEALKKALDGVKEMLKKNPYKRDLMKAK